MLRFLLISVSLCFACGMHGEDITGTITIKRKLTKRSVTAAVSIYQRGPDVELAKDPEKDPLAFERTRVAIWVEGPGPTTQDRASMPQSGRRFSPDLIVVPVGATVSFPNMDPIFHNVFSLSRPQMFDLGNYPRGETRNVAFPKPGIVYVNCHLHPNMAGVIVVTPNRWNARADRTGQFELHGVPPGEYTVVAWHKAAGYFRQTVRVVPGSGAKIDFFIPFGELKSDRDIAEK
jgi:plastocyanin